MLVYQRVILGENIYPLVMTNGLPWKPWSIYTVDGLPSDSMVIFHGYVK